MPLLWIRRDFSTRSAVYGSANWLDKDCIGLARMLEKKRLVFSKRVSAHPILWIFSGLSTVALFDSLFLPAKPGFYAVFLSHLARARADGAPCAARKLAGPGSEAVSRTWSACFQSNRCDRRQPMRCRFSQFFCVHPGLHVANPFLCRCQSVQPEACRPLRLHGRQGLRDRDFLPNLASARRSLTPASARMCARACTPCAALIFLINRDRYKAGSSSKRRLNCG